MPAQESRLSPHQRRAALQVLDRNRLSQLTEQFGLEVEDRRVLENHINALVRSRSADFSEILGQLKREELQAICDALGLERGGREKEVLVRRILGLGEPQQAELGLRSPPPPSTAPEEPTPAKAKATKKNGGDLGFEDTLSTASFSRTSPATPYSAHHQS